MLTCTFILIIFVSFFIVFDLLKNKDRKIPEFFVGVEAAYGNVDDCKELVNKVKNYTNLFVVGSTAVTSNQTSLCMVCDYVYDAGLSFIVHFSNPSVYPFSIKEWVAEAEEKYGKSFLGVYCFDEPGGRQLDNETRFVPTADNYGMAAENFVFYLYLHLERMRLGVKLFTSDYGLYWFDYKAHYDVVLAELGWNHSRQLNIALCRGAANIQNKEWGVIVTWTYRNPPYIESSEKLYNDMILAYHAGAKYIVIFNHPKILQYGILTEEHFDSLQKFWNYVHNHPEKHGSVKGELAYVLPKDYGFGFRTPEDTIWGLWKADELSRKIWEDINNILEKHGLLVDVVYDDPKFKSTIKNRYRQLIFWNASCIS